MALNRRQSPTLATGTYYAGVGRPDNVPRRIYTPAVVHGLRYVNMKTAMGHQRRAATWRMSRSLAARISYYGVSNCHGRVLANTIDAGLPRHNVHH